MTRLRRTALSALLAIPACSAPPTVPAAHAVASGAAPSSEADMLERSLPGVVLVLSSLANGKMTFGAGILLGEEGRVLTNVHVVAHATSIGAMFYDPRRKSYIPEDGGLARYIFENERDIHRAVLERGDPTLDLAILKIDAPPPGVRTLTFRAEPARVGERVFALGHPSETVWSFSAGVVSSLHSGVIQTDAAINHGNSGGPLIDAAGRILGVNTSKLFGESKGVAFARPIALARPLAESGATAKPSVAVDLSTPERASTTCAQAWEFGSSALADCMDPHPVYQLMIAVAAKTEHPRPGAAKGTAQAGVADEATFVAHFRETMVRMARGESISDQIHRAANEAASDAPGGSAWTAEKQEVLGSRIVRDVEATTTGMSQGIFERTGLKIDPSNPGDQQQILKMGRRIEAVREVSPERAWVAIRGRNLDATEYRYAEFYERRDGMWRQDGYPDADAVKSLPPGFPSPIMTFDEGVRAMSESARDPGEPRPRPTHKATAPPRTGVAK